MIYKSNKNTSIMGNMKYLQSITEALNVEESTEEKKFTVEITSGEDTTTFEYEDVNQFFTEDVKSLKEGDSIKFPEVESVINVIENFDTVKESIENGEFKTETSTEEEVTESITATVEFVKNTNVTNENETFEDLFCAICSITEGEGEEATKKYFVIYEQ